MTQEVKGNGVFGKKWKFGKLVISRQPVDLEMQRDRCSQTDRIGKSEQQLEDAYTCGAAGGLLI